jgi:large-conductance mechanosensitive channel
MHDHVIERANLRDLAIALVIGLALAALVGTVSGCNPQLKVTRPN